MPQTQTQGGQDPLLSPRNGEKFTHDEHYNHYVPEAAPQQTQAQAQP